jgi:hypothetical protein
VVDQTGGVLPGVTIDLIVDAATELTTITDLYRFEHVPARRVELTYRLLNFSVMRRAVEVTGQIIPSLTERTTAPAADHPAQGETPRMSWPGCSNGLEHCPNYGGALKIIAAIEDPPVIVKILRHLGLPTSPAACAGASSDLFQTI